jgi:hypothetical protein
MKRILVPVGFLVVAFLLVVWPNTLRAQGGFEPVTGDAFTKAMPNDFYLEGNRIPVDKNNAVLLKNAKGARVVLAILDTAGYSSQIQQKYTGMLISETKLSVCSIAIGVGSYGFGLDRPKAPSTADAKFNLYNQAGTKVGLCAVKIDDTIKQPKPLAVTAEGGTTKLDLGKYAVEIK